MLLWKLVNTFWLAREYASIHDKFVYKNKFWLLSEIKEFKFQVADWVDQPNLT